MHCLSRASAQGPLHKKSEHYCSEQCYEVHASSFKAVPAFISKWKLRKYRELKDPFIRYRSNARRKTSRLVKDGILKKSPCVVCGRPEVLPHHEDYGSPGDVIWLCEEHHKQYHDGQIGLFDNRLWWNPKRLLPHTVRRNMPKKYRQEYERFKKVKKVKNSGK